MVSPRIAPRPENSAAAIVTDEAVCVQITGPRIHIWSYDEGNASSRNSSPKVQPKGSSPPTPLSTTPSTHNVTLSAELRFAFSEPKQITRGRLQLRRHERSCRCCLLASFGS